MEWLNFNHLYYFWIVAREGSIARAAELLDVAPPTISAQLRSLERVLGEKLFKRSGRGLILTDVGHVAFRHADEMFAAGRAMIDAIRSRPTGRPLRLVVGVADQLPKRIAYRLIQPALKLPEPIQLRCREGPPETLLAELAVYGLDVVLSDTPIGTEVRVKAYNHLLGDCGVAIMAVPSLAESVQAGFPRSLDGAPFLLPPRSAALRRALDQWFDAQTIRPRVRAELDDSALIKVFGQAGEGFFAVPNVIVPEVSRQFGVEVVGQIDEVRERFYAISVERRLKNPAVVAISEAAKREIFN